MLQEMTLKEAMKAHQAGRSVLVMEKSFVNDPSGEWMVTELSAIFKDSRFLVDVPVNVNQEFEAAVQEMEIPMPTQKAGKASGSRKPVDAGKMQALKKAGWTQAKIADEMGVSEATVSTYLKRMGGVNESKELAEEGSRQHGSEADRCR